MKSTLFSAVALPTRLANLAWLLVRLHLGYTMVLSGFPKLTPLPSPEWFVQMVTEMGFTFPSPVFWAVLATWGEVAGGVLLLLGLLTRWAALQLAIQFAIIAFHWYHEPAFFTTLYVQQELFWSFVLLAAVGGGRYSLDYWLLNRPQAAPMPGTTFAASLTSAALLLCLGRLVFIEARAARIPEPPTGPVTRQTISNSLRRLPIQSVPAFKWLPLRAPSKSCSPAPPAWWVKASCSNASATSA